VCRLVSCEIKHDFTGPGLVHVRENISAMIAPEAQLFNLKDGGKTHICDTIVRHSVSNDASVTCCSLLSSE
jgi:hypothetical protein